MARKILLADDSVTAQNMGRKILADAGYEVITVNNGSAALKRVGEHRPDLIVLDVYMPGYSGLEVCQRLKEAGDTARIPILLTVGKLEPFKPEEARRVRADGFIVKPFEASELLSALSKLEDKVVPRQESSKPGRFARATAAIEEGRYDRSMAVEDDDTGWKRRISFPTKKKEEKPAEKEIDTAEIYNPVNKDLRTVIEHKIEHAPAAPAEVPQSEAQVNVAALAPEGLPKDVTPEEIAAIAAAAAQIKAKEELSAAPATEMPVNAPTAIDVAKPSAEPEAKQETPAPETAAVPAVSAAPVTFAEQKPEEKAPQEAAQEEKPEPVSTQADAASAMMGLETQMIAVHNIDSAIREWSQASADSAPEPVTMAVSASELPVATPLRWTAAAVVVAPEEAAISLEQEMQKAYAAYAAAEGGHAGSASTTVETKPAVAEPIPAPVAQAEQSPVETSTTPSALEVPPSPAPEAIQSLAAVSEAATEAVSAAVKELEQVAAKYEAELSPASTEPVSQIATPTAAVESAISAFEPPAKIEAQSAEQIADRVEFKAETKIDEEKIDERVEPKLEAKVEEDKIEEVKIEVKKIDEKPEEPAIKEEEAGAGSELSVPIAEAAATETQPESQAPVTHEEVRHEKQDEEKDKETLTAIPATPEVVAQVDVPEVKTDTEEVTSDPVPASSASIRGTDEMAKRESETAAAWASWRKIRETGSPKPAEAVSKEPEELPQDRAAMAVAAGAESKPEESTSSLDTDPEIASIVDSVLADMRPKIVEEIARKLGKKK